MRDPAHLADLHQDEARLRGHAAVEAARQRPVPAGDHRRHHPVPARDVRDLEVLAPPARVRDVDIPRDAVHGLDEVRVREEAGVQEGDGDAPARGTRSGAPMRSGVGRIGIASAETEWRRSASRAVPNRRAQSRHRPRRGSQPGVFALTSETRSGSIPLAGDPVLHGDRPVAGRAVEGPLGGGVGRRGRRGGVARRHGSGQPTIIPLRGVKSCGAPPRMRAGGARTL